MLRILIFLFACLATTLQAQKAPIDKVIAVVGNKIILWSDVEAQHKMLAAQQEKLPENIYCIIFDQLMSNALMLSQADQDSVFADDMEVQAQLDSRIEQILAYMGGQEEQFIAYYNMTPSEMKERMRDDMADQLVVEKMSGQISSAVTITPKEVKDFFMAIPKDSLPYFKSEVELGEIVIKPKVNDEQDRRARERAEDLRRRIVEDGEDFGKLAYDNSDDPGSRRFYGDLGIVGRGQFVPEFEAVAFQLDKEEISEVVKTDFGYHIIQLIERLGNNIHARHILVRPKIMFADMDKARAKADSIRNLIVIDTFSFDEAVQLFSEDDFSKTRNGQILNPQTGEPYIETGEIDPEIFFAIEKLKVGEVSEPIEFVQPDNETIFRLVQIRNRTEPHVANLKDDYSRIQKAALESKKGRSITDWIKKAIPNHYIELRIDDIPQLRDCTLLSRWRAGKP